MSKMTERILIAILLVVAVTFAMHNARAGIFVNCDSGWFAELTTKLSNNTSSA